VNPANPTLLVIEDNPGDVHLIRAMLRSVRGANFQVESADRLSAGLDRLAQGGVDVVLLDLMLPDSAGLKTVELAHANAPRTPIIVLTGQDDDVLGASAVWAGAQDYLVKGKIDGALLSRSVRYAIGRHAIQAQARHQAFVDPVTGLYDLKGFQSLAAREMKLAGRRREELTLILIAPLGGGDAAHACSPSQAHHVLAEAARALRATCRETDLLARIGAAELALLAIGAPANHAPAITARFLGKLRAAAPADSPAPAHPLQTGVAGWDPGVPLPLDALIHNARQAMAPAP
jgi:diguanylate cyclase (GGDEF)-like protein